MFLQMYIILRVAKTKSSILKMWSDFSLNIKNLNLRLPGKLYNGKLYMIGNGNENEVYDISSNAWSTWPALPVKTGGSPCMVVWRNSFIVFGGQAQAALTTVQAFNLITQV